MGLIVVIAFSSLTGEFLRAVNDDQYFLVHEDETIFYGSAQVFAGSQSLQAESCIFEDVSKFGKFNWYGPGYNAVYGSVQLLFGHSWSLFIRFHFALALLVILLVLLIPIDWESKLLVAGALLISETFSGYIFSYFPEMLHFFFSAVLTLLLVLIYKQNEKRSLITTYVALVLLFTFCRVTTIFWLAALLPMGDNWKKRVPFILVFSIGVMAAIIYQKFCLAPPFAPQMFKLEDLYSFHIGRFIFNTTTAVWNNVREIITYNSFPVNLLLVLMVMAGLNYRKSRDKLQLSVLLIALCLFGVLMALYTVHPFFFVKQTAMLVPCLLVAAVRGPYTWMKWVVFVILIYHWVPVNKDRADIIKEHRQAYVKLIENEPLRKAFQQIRDVVVSDQDVVVLWCYHEYDYGNNAQSLLPYSTTGDHPIMYTSNFAYDPKTTSEQKFKFHHKLKIDYILSRQQLPWSTLEEVLRTPYFYFYRKTGA